MKRYFCSSIFIVCLVCCFAFSVSAEPAAYMRSGVYYDFMEFSIISFKSGSSGYVPSSGLNTTSTSVSNYSFKLDYSGFYHCSTYLATVEIENCTSTPVFKLNSISGSILSHDQNSFIISFDTSNIADLGLLWLEINNVVTSKNSRIALIDLTGIGFTNTVFGNFKQIQLRSNLPSTEQNNINVASYTLNYQATINPALSGPGPNLAVTLLVDRPSEPHEFISFRFYLPGSHVEYNPYTDSFDLVAGSPLISVGLGYAQTAASVSPFPGAVIYQSANNTINFNGAPSICYDVTVDVSNANVSSPYYAITVELYPFVFIPNTRTVIWNARFNGGGCGDYVSESNDLNTLVNWYYSYSLYKYNGWVNTFSNYMDSILAALNGEGLMDNTNQAISDNKDLEDAAVAGAIDAVGSITSIDLPDEFTSNVSIISAVGSSLVSGSVAPVYLCLVIIPLTVGIISKLLNGGD